MILYKRKKADISDMSSFSMMRYFQARGKRYVCFCMIAVKKSGPVLRLIDEKQVLMALCVEFIPKSNH